MRFSRLTLNGFKSFVDPTDLIIADGLTGVVGPNGCGKSNLLEALRWVMGENRPTAMRGGGMEDVIFAGASTRPARNFAEVSLILENDERTAPAGFNDADRIDVIRRITRDVGSAYKANGRDVRARDVQMLFADASTGAHSPALVRQGQIAELINAKPKARRRILEEAAGISGLYQRRHEAELKLRGAETNLLRVEDVIEQLATQLVQLARQARQAARYREIGDQLRRSEGVLLFRRWKEASDAALATENGLKEATLAAAQAEGAARQAAKARVESDGALPPLREEEAIAAAVLQRLHVERDTLDAEEKQANDTIRRLEALIAQLSSDRAREASLNADAGRTIERLEIEANELTAASEGHEARVEVASAVAHDAAADLQKHETAFAEVTEDVARLAARHQSASRLIEDTQKTLARSERAAEEAQAATDRAKDVVERSRHEARAAAQEQGTAAHQAEMAEASLIETEARRADVQGREADARAILSEADGHAKALKAEVSALARLVERDASERATIVDQVRVQDGFERALGAALADDLRMPEADDETPSGWVNLGGYSPVQPLPEGVPALTNFVTIPEVLERRMAQVGLVAPEDGPRLQAGLRPGQRLVSQNGDLWRWDGYRASAEDAPSAAALKLQQLNRLEALKQDLVAATAKADGARQAFELLSRELAELTAADRAERDKRRAADKAVADANRRLSRAEADENIAAGKLESLNLAVIRHREEADAVRLALTDAEAAQRELPDLEKARAAIEGKQEAVETARAAMLSRRSELDALQREGDDRTRRLREITQEMTNWRNRLETAEERIREMDARRSTSEAELTTASAQPAEIGTRRDKIAASITDAEKRKAAASDALSTAESALRRAEQAERDAERAASDAREARAGALARAEAAQATLGAAADRISEVLDLSPTQLLDSLDIDPAAMPSADSAEADVNRLRRQRDALGAVNLRAEEDAAEVQGEHDTLAAEKADLEEAISRLRSGINSLNREGRERLLTAFDEVNKNFGRLFPHLFGGGDAKLVMVESDDPLEAGLEIMCQPPGKKLSTLSLLSGGEQTLTALALIFAVFLANPAPICVLDEVDAPLDDANVTRFCDLLDEMTRQTETRFLIITHHAVTMSRMDRLFGVTMAEQGVSQLVSVDLKRAEALVA